MKINEQVHEYIDDETNQTKHDQMIRVTDLENKSASILPGIGPQRAARINEKEVHSALQVMGLYLYCMRSYTLMQQELNSECDARIGDRDMMALFKFCQKHAYRHGPPGF